MALPLKYHWRHLLMRRTTTLLTMLVVAAVVGTFAWLLGFVFTLERSLAVAADERKLIVLQRGAISETNSSISPEELNRLQQLSAVERDDSGRALISPELFWLTQLPRVRDETRRANVALRGVTELALKVHRNVRLLGPMFSTGAPEVVVGLKAARQFRGLNVGDVIRLGFGENRDYRVVAHFSAEGGPMESEIWGYLPSLQSAYSRPSYSSASLRLVPDTRPQDVIAQIEGPAIQLGALREADYWQEQARSVRTYQAICYVLVAIMALAAIFSIANTMYATVAGRTREIAMLRTIGYRPVHILLGFVIEAVLLATIGGVLGCIACWVWLLGAGGTKDMFAASSFTALAFEIRLTPLVAVIALAAVTLVGALGAFFPARRAARLQVVSALREP